MIRWGICGSGAVSNDFVNAVLLLPAEKHKVVAVAASSLENAENFREKNGIEEAIAYGSYVDLFNDVSVDVVYIGLLNHLHKAAVIGALNSDKHVLCEKPLGVNLSEVQQMIQIAKEKKKFLMEGSSKMIREFGGGCLLATGCYLPMVALHVFEEMPKTIRATGFLNQQSKQTFPKPEPTLILIMDRTAMGGAVV